MKKNVLLLYFSVVTALCTNAQQIIYTAFNYETFRHWTFLDSDGDDFNWEIIDRSTYEGLELQGDLINSFSLQPYNFDPLTPNNYAYSVPVNCTAFENVSLRFKRLSTGVATKHAEKYSIYAMRATSTAELELALPTAIPLYTETIEVGRILEERTVDLSFLDGMDSVYIVVRHHDCTDQFFLTIDDVIVEGNISTASINEVKISEQLKVFPQPMNHKLTVSYNEEIASISLFDKSGKLVQTTSNLNSKSHVIMTEDLSPGVYILKVQTASGTVLTQKCVK